MSRFPTQWKIVNQYRFQAENAIDERQSSGIRDLKT